MSEIRFTTLKPDCHPVRDKRTGVITMPLVLHDAHGKPSGETELLLDGVGAELMHAYLNWTLNGIDVPRSVR